MLSALQLRCQFSLSVTAPWSWPCFRFTYASIFRIQRLLGRFLSRLVYAKFPAEKCARFDQKPSRDAHQCFLRLHKIEYHSLPGFIRLGGLELGNICTEITRTVTCSGSFLVSSLGARMFVWHKVGRYQSYLFVARLASGRLCSKTGIIFLFKIVSVGKHDLDEQCRSVGCTPMFVEACCNIYHQGCD